MKTKRPPGGGLSFRAQTRSMIVVVVVVMIVVMLVRNVVALVLDDLGEFLAGHRLVGLGGEFGDIVDDLVLEHRGAQAGESRRVLAVIVVNLLLLAREAA